MDRIYEKICYCHSALGEEYFYHMLRNPIKDWKKLQILEKKISCFLDEKPPVSLQKELIGLGKIKKYSMQKYLDFLIGQEKKSNLVAKFIYNIIHEHEAYIVSCIFIFFTWIT